MKCGSHITTLGVCLLALSACVSHYDRGDHLYRQGDLRGAIDTWKAVPLDHMDYDRTKNRLQVVEGEFDRMLRRYEKQAQFFEGEERLAEAVLYYRLAYNLDPSRTHLLERVQSLARRLDSSETRARKAMNLALDRGRLRQAKKEAEKLERLDPFNAALLIEARQVHAAVGAEVVRNLEAGKRAYAAGRRDTARESFQRVLRLDERNETALGYLSYIRRFETMEAQRKIPPPPRSISREEILGEGHYRSAAQAEQAGEPFWALSEYEAALRVNPKHSAARRALSKLRRQLQPRVHELYEAGKRYFQEEDLHNALHLWRRVLLIDPTHPKTLANVERAERILSRLEEIQTDDS